MSWFPTMDLRWIERIGCGPGYRVKVLQQRWEKRWGQDIGGEEWRDIPIADPGIALAEHYAGMRLPESEGQSSEAITVEHYAEIWDQFFKGLITPNEARERLQIPMPPVKPPRKDDL